MGLPKIIYNLGHAKLFLSIHQKGKEGKVYTGKVIRSFAPYNQPLQSSL
jgi:hypothetical protein